MSFADLRIVAIATILAVTYGTFLFMNASVEDSPTYPQGSINSTDYNTPDPGSFWDTIKEIGSMNVNNPEIFFINTMLFGVIALLLVFIGLRFLRGTG